MLVLLYVALAWIAVDVVVVSAWHHAHVVARRGRPGGASMPSTTPAVVFLAGESHHRSGQASPTATRPGYFHLIDA